MKEFMKLGLVLVLFLTSVLTFNHMSGLNFILSVSLVLFPFAFVWALVMKQLVRFIREGIKNWVTYSNNMQNFVVLFVSLGFFAYAFNETPVSAVLHQPLLALSAFPFLLFLSIALTYWVMSMIGVHPIATIAILVEVLQPIFGVLNPVSLGIMLIVSPLAASPSSPYGVTVTLTSMNLHVSPYRVVWRNMGFTATLMLLAATVAYLLL